MASNNNNNNISGSNGNNSPGVEAQVHAELKGKVKYLQFPSEAKLAQYQQVLQDYKVDNTQPLFKLFMGQVGHTFGHEHVAWLVDALTNENCVVRVDHVGKRNSFTGCCWVYVTSEEAQHKVLALSKHVLCDLNGLWHCESEEETEVLKNYVDKAKESFQKGGQRRVPRDSLVVEVPQDRPQRKTKEHSEKDMYDMVTPFGMAPTAWWPMGMPPMPVWGMPPNPYLPPYSGVANPLVACPQGHMLSGRVTPAEGYACNVCRKEFPAGTYMFECRDCDYDACGICFAACVRGELEHTDSTSSNSRNRSDELNGMSSRDPSSCIIDNDGVWATIPTTTGPVPSTAGSIW